MRLYDKLQGLVNIRKMQEKIESDPMIQKKKNK